MSTTERLSIVLPSEMAQLIREKVRAGAYPSNSELVREALRGWIAHESQLVALDGAMARGVADVAAGRTQNIEKVRDDIRSRFRYSQEDSK